MPYALVSIILFLLVSQAGASSYQQTLAQIKAEQNQLLHSYHSSNNKGRVLKQAGQSLHHIITDKISPYWIGTRWSFNGTSSTPGKGSIACGYFVTTVLQHAGMRLNRYQLAQMASEKMILRLTRNIKRYRHVEFAAFLGSIKKWGKGLYVVGLDNHTGFIHYDGRKIYFIHSAFAWPFSVQRQLAGKSSILASSQYRVLGRLDNDKMLIRKWILGQAL